MHVAGPVDRDPGRPAIRLPGEREEDRGVRGQTHAEKHHSQKERDPNGPISVLFRPGSSPALSTQGFATLAAKKTECYLHDAIIAEDSAGEQTGAMRGGPARADIQGV
jgi:hypothetical protein